MALTIAQVLDDVTLESQEYFDFEQGTGDELQLMSVWLSDTQKDMLHGGMWSHLLTGVTTFATTASTRIYALTPHDVHRIIAIFDETAQAFLSPLESVFPPASTASPNPAPQSPRPATDAAIFRTDTIFPGYYTLITTVTNDVASHAVHLFGVPNSDHIGTMTVYYTKHAPTIASALDDTSLIIDQDGRHVLKAGVLWRMYLYLDQPMKADRWKAIFDAGRLGETL